MDPIVIDVSKSLEEQIKSLTDGVNALIVLVGGLPAVVPFDPSDILAQVAKLETDHDSLAGRLDADEKTLLAMGDHINGLPVGGNDYAEAIATIHTKVNELYLETVGPAGANVPFPVPIASED